MCPEYKCLISVIVDSICIFLTVSVVLPSPWTGLVNVSVNFVHMHRVKCNITISKQRFSKCLFTMSTVSVSMPNADTYGW